MNASLLRGRLQVRILPGSPLLPENVPYLRGKPNAWREGGGLPVLVSSTGEMLIRSRRTASRDKRVFTEAIIELSQI